MSEFKYHGDIKFNNTIEPQYQAPLDTRLVVTDVSSLYITEGENEKNAVLYNKAYDGMIVATFVDNKANAYILNDSAPYKPGNVLTINATNFYNYWGKIDINTKEYVNTVINSSINNAINNTDSSITAIKNYVSATEYKIVKNDVANNGYFSTYRLLFKGFGQNDFTDVECSTIDIPKDYVLKEVHVCKAETNSENKLIETHRLTDTSINVWNSDTNPVYLHFIWHTEDSSTITSDSFVKVSDMIAADISGTVSRVDILEAYTSDTSTRFKNYTSDTDSSISYLKTYTSDTSTRFASYVNTATIELGYVNSSINRIDSSILNLYIRLDDVSNNVISTINSSINILNTNIASADAVFSTYKTTNDTNISNLTTDVDNVSIFANEINAEFNVYKNDNDSSINNINASLDTMNATISSNYNTLDSSIRGTYISLAEREEIIATALTNLNTRVTELEQLHQATVLDIGAITAFLIEKYPEPNGFISFSNEYHTENM